MLFTVEQEKELKKATRYNINEEFKFQPKYWRKVRKERRNCFNHTGK